MESALNRVTTSPEERGLGENPGEWIERQCAALGVAVSQVALEAGVQRSTVYRWRRGETWPNWKSFDRVRGVINGYWDRSERKGR